MEDPPQISSLMCFQDRKRISMGVPVMDEDGKVKLFGKLDLTGKPVFLRFLIRVEIVLVQADLPHRFHLVMRPGKRSNGCKRLLRRILCPLRMDADCCI